MGSDRHAKSNQCDFCACRHRVLKGWSSTPVLPLMVAPTLLFMTHHSLQMLGQCRKNVNRVPVSGSDFGRGTIDLLRPIVDPCAHGCGAPRDPPRPQMALGWDLAGRQVFVDGCSRPAVADLQTANRGTGNCPPTAGAGPAVRQRMRLATSSHSVPAASDMSSIASPVNARRT